MRSLDASLPILTTIMSAPLFLSFQLERPPDFFYGFPFTLLWTWGVLATIAAPVLIAVEVAYCLTAIIIANRSGTSLRWHLCSLIVATAAYLVFRLARSSA